MNEMLLAAATDLRVILLFAAATNLIFSLQDGKATLSQSLTEEVTGSIWGAG